MDVAGQGKLFLKPIPKQPVNAARNLNNIHLSNLNKDNVHLITFQPLVQWKSKRPLPNRVPDFNNHGGVLQSDGIKKVVSDNNDIENLNSRNSLSAKIIHVGEVGHGAGSIITIGTGPVLIGTASFGPHIGPALWILVLMLLLISSIIWAILNLIYFTRQNHHCQSYARREGKNHGNGTLIKQTKYSGGQFFLSETENNLPIETASLSQQSGFHQRMIAGPISPSSTSVCSSANQNIYSPKYGLLLLEGLSRTRIIECSKVEVIFSISTDNQPNCYLSKNDEKITHCQSSSFHDCQEIFLLSQEMFLVGKMKNILGRNTTDPFVIQIWRAKDGVLVKDLIGSSSSSTMTCDAVCSIQDEFLVLIRQGEVSVWNVKTKTMICRSVLGNSQIVRGQWHVRPTKSELEIVILCRQLHGDTTDIFVISFDELLDGSARAIHRSFGGNDFFSLIPSTILIIGSITGELITWDFCDNRSSLLCKYQGTSIHNLWTSNTGDQIAVQLKDKLSIWKTHPWIQLPNINISSSRVCTMAFGLHAGVHNILAVALDDRSINIYNCLSGDLLGILNGRFNILNMLFNFDCSSLVTISDRANHHQLSRFHVPLTKIE